MRRIRALSVVVAGTLGVAFSNLAAQDQEAGSPAAGSASERPEEAAVEPADAEAAEPQPSAIDSFYDAMTAENAAAKVDSFYGPQVVYEDPFGRVEGRVQLAGHYKKLLAGVQTLAVDVKEEFVSADETVAVWTMTFTHSSLNGGQTIVVDGVTHVRIVDGKVVGQKNYFDLGEMVYEHTTIVGWVVRWVKKRILSEAGDP